MKTLCGAVVRSCWRLQITSRLPNAHVPRLQRSGAESVDAAREEWWIGLRDAEREHYTNQGGNFNLDEAKYRLGFESALHPDCRGKSCEDVSARLKAKHGDDSTAPAFRQGYERGQDYLSQTRKQPVRERVSQGC